MDQAHDPILVRLRARGAAFPSVRPSEHHSCRCRRAGLFLSPGGADAGSGVPMVGWLLGEKQETAAGRCGELVELVGHVGVVTKEHRGRGNFGSDAGVFALLVFGGVVGVVDEEINRAVELLEALDRISVEDVSGLPVRTLEQPAGLGVDVGADVAPWVAFGLIAEQGSGQHTAAQAFVDAGFHHDAGLEGPHQGIPTEVAAVAHVEVGGDGAVGAGGELVEMAPQTLVVAQFLDPVVGLLQAATGDHAHPAGQLAQVEISKIVGEVGGFAGALGPVDQFTETGFEVRAESKSQPVELLLRVLLGTLVGSDSRLMQLLLHQLGIELLKTL